MASILLLEDNAALRRILVKTLSDDGHTVVSRENGLAVYDLSVLDQADLMITDLVMPRVDGLDAIRTARAHRDDFKVIAISGGSESFGQDYLKVASTFGASGVLKKPFEPEALLSVVNATLAA